ncbi:unnamed protein product [Rangifer tarandus platyrhynchus]|uniref:Uncharacterized protein n=2 Tax=Rangifer tarandus platyrhynchus TaxID=3082113 RepID=A0AC59YBT3_RANTA|nr:unnamed protein product [Rangifer tarandus platyrhynchus]
MTLPACEVGTTIIITNVTIIITTIITNTFTIITTIKSKQTGPSRWSSLLWAWTCKQSSRTPADSLQPQTIAFYAFYFPMMSSYFFPFLVWLARLVNCYFMNS